MGVRNRSVSAAASPLAIFLVGTIALALWLGYQALDAALSHRRTAEAVLSDYASISATEMAYTVDHELEDLLDEVFDVVLRDRFRRWRSPSAEMMIAEMREAANYQRCPCPGFRDPVGVFRWSAGSFELTPDTLPARLAQGIVEGTRRPRPVRAENEPGLFVLDGQSTGLAPLIVGFVRTEEPAQDPDGAPDVDLPAGWDTPFALSAISQSPGRQGPERVTSVDTVTYGFVVTREAFAQLIAEWYDDEPLLPQPIAGGQPNDSLLHVKIAERTAGTIFESPAGFPTQLSATIPVSADFPDLTVTAAVRPDAVSRLIIGGLPRSRLPLLSLLLVLTVGVGFAATIQLRREQTFQRLRDDFVSGVSHELRTPLAQIRMFAELQQSGRLSDARDAERATFVIHREAVRLSHLVENILQFSRMRRLPGRHLPMEELDLAGAIIDGTDAVYPLLADRGMHLDIDAEPDLRVTANREALTRIVVNLLDNAIKYGPPGQSILVQVERAADSARVSVTDEGPGVPAKERERVFAPYFRLERSVRSQVAGTGIGLSVVADLAALQDGRAWVEEGVGGGARFVVELPLAPPTLTPGTVERDENGDRTDEPERNTLPDRNDAVA